MLAVLLCTTQPLAGWVCAVGLLCMWLGIGRSGILLMRLSAVNEEVCLGVSRCAIHILRAVQGFVEAGVHGGMKEAFELLTREEYIAIMTNLVRIQGRVGTETAVRVGLEVMGDQKARPSALLAPQGAPSPAGVPCMRQRHRMTLLVRLRAKVLDQRPGFGGCSLCQPAVAATRPKLRGPFGAGVHRALAIKLQHKGAEHAWRIALITSGRVGLLRAGACGRRASRPTLTLPGSACCAQGIGALA